MTFRPMTAAAVARRRAHTLNGHASRFLECPPVVDPEVRRILRETRDILNAVLARAEVQPEEDS
jgi:hypothetical protein